MRFKTFVLTSIYSLCLFVFSFGWNVSFAAQSQSSELSGEQVISELNELPATDRRRIPLLVNAVQQLRRSEPDTAIEYAEQGFQLLQNSPWPEQEAFLAGYLAKIYLERRELEVAERLITRGIEAATESANEDTLAINLFNQAIKYQLSNELVLALNVYQELQKIYLKSNNLARLASTYNNVGIIEQKLGNIERALISFQKALPIYKKGKNTVHLANTTMNIGQIFYFLKDYPQAEQNYLAGLALINQESAPLSFAEGHQRLGILYRETGQYDKSQFHLNTGISVMQTFNLNGALISNYFEQIRLAEKKKDLELLNFAIARAEQLLTKDTSLETFLSANYFRALVAAINQDWLAAELHIDALFENELYQHRYFELQDALELAFKIKNTLGKADEANTMLLRSFKHYQAQQKLSRDSQLSQYAQLYKTNEKERALTLLKKQAIMQENQWLKEQQQSRLYLFLSVVSGLLLLSFVVFAWQRHRRLTRENELNYQLMAEKKQFFADISHELRTPLTVFKLKMQELEYDIAEDPQSVYQLLYDRIDSFNHLINDISLLAQNDEGKMELNFERVSLLEFFQMRVDDLKTLAKKHRLSVSSSLCLTPLDVGNFDAARMRQVLCNLFSNACRYTTAPGQIQFLVSIHRQNLQIVIEDSAPNLTDEQLDKVFDRLYRADKSRSRKLGGSGLGLSICKSLIKAHGGEIHAFQSQLGGVKISIDLPVVKELK